jgi:hypothetical protein
MLRRMAIRHEVTRLSLDAGQPYDAFRTRFEAAVPALGLRIFWRSERDGEPPATSYLVGNPVLVEQLYALDPAVLSVVPFHMAITGGPAVRLTFDQPSTHLASFADPAFAELAVRVDAKFAALLEQVGVEDHTTLLRAGPHV